MIEYIPTNAELLKFIEGHLIFLTFIYAIFRAMFPESKILRAIGDTFKSFTARIPTGKKGK